MLQSPHLFSKGTTWTQEMVWCIINNFDYKTAKGISLETRVPFFEYVGISDAGDQSVLCKRLVLIKIIKPYYKYLI